MLTAAARARQFGRYQCEAAIQSVHVGRAVTGSVDRNALLTLYDLLVTQTESVGARIARAVLLADAGDPQAGIAAIEALDPARIAGHQPYWVARSAILERLGRRHAAAAALAKAKTLTATRRCGPIWRIAARRWTTAPVDGARPGPRHTKLRQAHGHDPRRPGGEAGRGRRRTVIPDDRWYRVRAH
ncbi:MAG: hypothetical protein JKP98_08050 [Rhodobacteraceae bacterium]|nr:hypothetical protein [Paracoccaceae bacterium]